MHLKMSTNVSNCPQMYLNSLKLTIISADYLISLLIITISGKNCTILTISKENIMILIGQTGYSPTAIVF